jgi:RNase P/RNase MRP subunit POP5
MENVTIFLNKKTKVKILTKEVFRSYKYLHLVRLYEDHTNFSSFGRNIWHYWSCVFSYLFFLQELELLPVKELQNNIYIKHPVSMEQYLMEGSYNKVIGTREDNCN